MGVGLVKDPCPRLSSTQYRLEWMQASIRHSCERSPQLRRVSLVGRYYANLYRGRRGKMIKLFRHGGDAASDALTRTVDIRQRDVTELP